MKNHMKHLEILCAKPLRIGFDKIDGLVKIHNNEIFSII